MSELIEIHFFSVKDKRYCLDVNSSAVFAVDLLMMRILELMPLKHFNEIHGELAFHYDEEQVKEAIEEIKKLQSHGFFKKNTKKDRLITNESRLNLNLLGLTLFVSNECNLDCIYCFNDGGTIDNQIDTHFMELSTAKKAVDFLLENSTGQIGIDFFGGEPLLNFKLIRQVVDYSKESNRTIQFSVITNGTILDDQLLKFLSENNFHVVVSYDGYLQNVQRPSKKGRDFREKIRENIVALSQSLPRENISVRCVITHETNDLASIIHEMNDLGTRLVPGCVTLPPGHPLNLTHDDFELLKDFETNYLFDAFQAGRLDWLTNTTNISNTILRIIKGGQRHFSCGVGKDILAVSTQGELYPCHRFVGMHNHKMGDIFKGIDRVSHKMYADLYVDNREACSKCWARYFCGGGCAHIAYTYNNQVDQVADDFCNLTRHEIELGLKLYAIAIDEKPSYLNKILETFEPQATS